jgi:hypothetical protein
MVDLIGQEMFHFVDIDHDQVFLLILFFYKQKDFSTPSFRVYEFNTGHMADEEVAINQRGIRSIN